MGAAEDKVTKRINETVDEVFKRYHRTMSFEEFEPMMKRSYVFYSKVLGLSLTNIKAVSEEKFPKLICDMTKDDEFVDFLFYIDIDLKKRELTKHDNHQ